MTEFGDRMKAQRRLLQAVNAVAWPEELFGLSNQAIDRWADRTGMPPESELVTLLRSASARLSFLANRSQMQVSDEYIQLSQDVEDVTGDVRHVIDRVIRNTGRRGATRGREGDPDRR